jgi:hypothetical protein
MQKLKMAKKYLLSLAVAVSFLAIFLTAVPAEAAPLSSKFCKSPDTAAEIQKCVSDNRIIKDLQAILNALTAGVAVIIVIMIIIGGIQYMTAGESPEAVNKAKQRIMNALIALLAFIFLGAFLQWLVPGGIFD